MKHLRWVGWFIVIEIVCLFAIRMEGVAEQRPPGMRIIETDEVVTILRDRLQKLVHDGNRRIEIKEIRGYQKTAVPPGILSTEVTVPEHAYRGGDIAAILRFHVNGQEVKRLNITARVEILADVVSVRHSLRKHQEIQGKDVQLAKRNISALAGDIVTDVKSVVGKRTTLSINAHEIMRASMVELPPLIKKGDRVVLVVENHQFKITALGEAREEGRWGERVKLVNLSSKKDVYGKVLNTNTVQIDF